jgi:hypothetical protein
MNAKAAHSVLYEKGKAENAPAPVQNFSAASQQSLDGRTLFFRYAAFHINHFSVRVGIQYCSCSITKSTTLAPMFLSRRPEVARLLLQHSSSLKDMGSTPLASKLLIMNHLRWQNGGNDNKSDNVSILSRYYPLADTHKFTGPFSPAFFRIR